MQLQILYRYIPCVKSCWTTTCFIVLQCIFHKYGGSGTIQRFDALCVLGMNILNEKIYIVLWFWFVILAAITAVNLVVRAMQLFCPTTRQRWDDSQLC